MRAEAAVRDDWQEGLLTWFATLGIPMLERQFELGALRYSLFTAIFNTIEGKKRAAHGRARNRKLGAVKCVCEYAERQAMAKFFHDLENRCRAHRIGVHGDQRTTLEAAEVALPPRCLATSNGWAVHNSIRTASQGAFMEALERHLLLKSFLKYGWAGFRLVETIKAKGMALHLLTSRLSASGYVSSLVAAQSTTYSGIAFGHSIGRIDQLSAADFWEGAIFEAADQIQALDGKPVDMSLEPDSWIMEGLKYYLESPFDLSVLSEGKDKAIETDDMPCHGYVRTFDLAPELGLSIPLFAAFAWGGDLIPLFHEPSLDKFGRSYVQMSLRKHGIAEIPSGRHPIL